MLVHNPRGSNQLLYNRPARAKIPPATAPMAGRPVGTAPAVLLVVAELRALDALWRMELAAFSPLWILEEMELAAAPVAVETSERRLASSEDAAASAELWALPMAAVAEEIRESAPEVKDDATEPAADVTDAMP